ncbi:MAG TPA: hypothetical protein VGG34_09980 [Opitutaceae bacterium]|jgi:hypothetical protein
MSAGLAVSGLALPAMFGADVIVTGVAAWLLVCALGLSAEGLLEACLAWLLSFSALAAGAAAALGELGGLCTSGFLACHVAALLFLTAARGRRLPGDGAAFRLAAGRARALLGAPAPERAALLCLCGALVLLGVVSSWSEPATADALTYHLPRVGQWLADRRVTLLATQDDRMNYVATIADLLSAWLLGGTASGFLPADLVQEMGGVLAVGATIGLARETGMGRTASLLSAALLFGMANVVVQFAASQNDLFTGGVFAASFFLWVRASRRGKGSPLGGLGAGLALGAKGTVFYLAPGAAVWTAAVACAASVPWRAWRSTLAFGILGVLLFAGPGFYRNWRAYGSILGPERWVEAHHQGAKSPGDYVRKLRWNLTCALAQEFDPQSQPPGLMRLGGAVITRLEATVPASDAYTLYGMGRRERLENGLVRRSEPDADYVSFGAVTLLLFAAGALAAGARPRAPGGMLCAAWAAGALIFIVFLEFMQQWHPYAFRYFVPAAPWIAVVSGWGIERLGAPLRTAVWALVLTAAACVGWRITFHTYQAGWLAATDPDHSLTHFVASQWARWSEGLEPESAPLSICMPEDSAISAFYRQPSARGVSFVPDAGAQSSTAEDFVRAKAGWVIVPAALFMGREGRVMGSAWLFGGDPSSRYSVAAFRRLGPGEAPEAMLYGDVSQAGAGQGRALHRVRIRSWDRRPVLLKFDNPQAGPVAYTLFSAKGGVLGRGKVPPAGARTVAVILPPGGISDLEVGFEPVDRRADDPLVELLPQAAVSGARSSPSQ